MVRALIEIVHDQERVFAELLEAQQELERLNRAGRQMGIIDGESSDVDVAMADVHAAQHGFEALAAEALQSALEPAPR